MKLWTFVLSASLLSISANSMANIGKVTDLAGQAASILHEKTTITAAKGTGISMADTVRTQQGKIGITFEDDTKVQVTENSKLVIDDFVYDPKSKSGGKLAVKIALGTARYASGQIAKSSPQNVAITTPTATVGVRGTDFTATVDELGASTFILLPSCPANYKDVEKDCVTGEISVSSDTGTVILNKPFQATKVESRGVNPLKPVILKLTEDAIGNLLILAPPKEFDKKESSTRIDMKGALDVDFLKETGLVNALDKANEQVWQDSLSRNLLDQNFLANILDIINSQLAAQLDLLNNTKSGLLPDYNAITGIIATVDEGSRVNLYRDDGSNVQSITVPYNQNSTIVQQQGMLEFSNRVNKGATTIITLIQK
jgi:hypothetical protein